MRAHSTSPQLPRTHSMHAPTASTRQQLVVVPAMLAPVSARPAGRRAGWARLRAPSGAPDRRTRVARRRCYRSTAALGGEGVVDSSVVDHNGRHEEVEAEEDEDHQEGADERGAAYCSTVPPWAARSSAGSLRTQHARISRAGVGGWVPGTGRASWPGVQPLRDRAWEARVGGRGRPAWVAQARATTPAVERGRSNSLLLLLVTNPRRPRARAGRSS